MTWIEHWMENADCVTDMFPSETRSAALYLLLLFALLQTPQLLLIVLLALGHPRPAALFRRDDDWEARPAPRWWESLLLLPAQTESTRTAKSPPPSNSARHLASPKRVYELTTQLATGDVCDVHEAFSGNGEYVIKIPRDGRAEPLLRHEQRVLCQLRDSAACGPCHEGLPQLVDSFSCGHTRMNVFAKRSGFFTVEDIRQRHPAGQDGRHLAWMFHRLLDVLGYVHEQGWVHGAVLPPHVMFHTRHQDIQLIDWIHAVPLHSTLTLAPRRYKHWYPAECALRQPVARSLDLYLAAKCIVFLAGGDPHGDASAWAMPSELRSFFRGCLLESPAMRPDDAWSLREELTEVLEGVNSPSEYD